MEVIGQAAVLAVLYVYQIRQTRLVKLARGSKELLFEKV
jgi:hypothetical protein